MLHLPMPTHAILKDGKWIDGYTPEEVRAMLAEVAATFTLDLDAVSRCLGTEEVMANGLTAAETDATASVFGLTKDSPAGKLVNQDAARMEWLEDFYSNDWHDQEWRDFMREVAEHGFRASIDKRVRVKS